MDSKRFDTLAKSLAAWTSRRRFVGAVIGSTAGTVAVRANSVSAQGEPTPTATPCDPATIKDASLAFLDSVHLWDLCASGEIDLTSEYVVISTEEPDEETDKIFIKPQFCAFYKQILSLIGEGTAATDLTAEQLIQLLNHWKLTVAAISVGIGDAFFAGPRTEPGTPFPETNGEITSQPTACTAGCVRDAIICMAKHAQDPCGMYVECIIPFVTCYIGIEGEDDPHKGCLHQLDNFCASPEPICCIGHCCGGGCKP